MVLDSLALGPYDFGIAVNEPNFDRAIYLPRLPREYYQGDAVVHWTLPISHRRQGWLDERFHAAFRELMLHTAAREGLFSPTYCLMPDHLHLVWMGLRLDSDQLNGMAFLRTHLEPNLAPQKFQHQAHDHVLKEKERRPNAFARACHYILENPLQAGLVKLANQWPFSGAVVSGYPTMHPLEDNFWPRFWKLYAQAKRPNAGTILRPLIRCSRRKKAHFSFPTSSRRKIRASLRRLLRSYRRLCRLTQ
jgi:putative transposase